jgi:hypothetical protein
MATRRNPTSPDEKVQLNRNGKATKDTAPEKPTTPNPEPSAPPAEEPDPFDPARFHIPQRLREGSQAKPLLTDLPVRAPDKSWWCRVHPEIMLDTRVIELKEERETYLVDPSLDARLRASKEPNYKRRRFYLAVNRQEKLFFWMVRCPEDDTREPDKYMKPILKAVEMAKAEWIRVSWNDEKKEHEIRTLPQVDSTDPSVLSDLNEEPIWPELTLAELIKLAFEDRFIQTSDHPILKRLRGGR